MGSAQSSAAAAISSGKENVNVSRSVIAAARAIHGAEAAAECSCSSEAEADDGGCLDLTDNLTEDCLELIFGKLPPRDRNSCSLVCKRWFRAEAKSRQLLLLTAKAQLVSDLPDLLIRFEHVTKLALKCDRKAASIDDGGLFLVGKYAKQLERLKLKGCKQVTDLGLEAFSKLCGTTLKKLSCGSCGFGAPGLNALIANCKSLEDLSVKKLKNLFQEADASIGPGHAKLKRLCLKDLSNGHVFEELVGGSRNLQTLNLARISGDLDKLLARSISQLPRLIELRMEKLRLTDKGLQEVARCISLQVLYVVKCPDCTDVGLSALAQGCRSLRKLHLDGCFLGRMGDEGLRVIGEKCVALRELVLIRLNIKSESLAVMGLHCSALERFAICNSDSFGDSELSCVVLRCQALKKLCIKSCGISDLGLETLAGGCPNLVKLKIRKCRGISAAGASQLQSSRKALIVAVDLPATISVQAPEVISISSDNRLRSHPATRSSFAKSVRLSFLAGPSNFVACTIRRIAPSS